jgi:hypothetical protein
MFQPGQVWTYRTRPGEEASRVTVLKVEPHEKLGTIVHIRMDGLAVKSPHSPTGVAEVIGHMPYDAAALAKSLIEVVATRDELPDFADGYRQWREAFDAGQGGVWTLPLDECVTAMEQAMNPPREAPDKRQSKNRSRPDRPKDSGSESSNP